MDIDKESLSMPKDVPESEFDGVRERRDFGPLDVPLQPILPSPFHDFSFSGLTGWRYYPTAYQEDRLGIKIDGKPSTDMVIPDSWSNRVIDHSRSLESRMQQFEALKAWEDAMRNGSGSARAEDTFMTDIDAKPAAPFQLESPMVTEHPQFELTSVEDARNSFANKRHQVDDATVATASTVTMTASSTPSIPANSSNSNISAVKLAGPDVIPKQELYFLYGKKPRKVQIKGTDYLTWDNGKPVQDVRYTSIFVCPITKEAFLAGNYGDTGEKEDGIWWYPKKNTAEHAAAARAWDCWNLREGRQNKKRLSIEAPYSKADAPELPIGRFPQKINEKIIQIQNEQSDPEDFGRRQAQIQIPRS